MNRNKFEKTLQIGKGIISIILIVWVIVLMIIILNSCKAPKPIIKEIEKIRIEKEVLRDTIIQVEIKPMYIEKTTKDTLSELRTKNAYSKALWSNGMLFHSLEQKGVEEAKIIIKDKFIYDTTKTKDTIVKEVERKLSKWQKFMLYSGYIVWGLISAGLTAVVVVAVTLVVEWIRKR